VDIHPFAEAIRAGSSSIMVGHLQIPAVDSLPATISEKIITDLLRKNLSFDGLILTDALTMKALQDFRNVSSRCLLAGADILLHPPDADLTVRELMNAVDLEELDERVVDRALTRIMKIKKKMQTGDETDPPFSEHTAISQFITENSITLMKEDPGLFPLRNSEHVRVVLAGERTYHSQTPFRDHYRTASVADDSQGITDEIIVVAIFTSVAAWKGTSGLDDEEMGLIEKRISRAAKSILISFGSPYVLKNFQRGDSLIAAYEATEQAQEAVIKCLRGEIQWRGHLPVRIDL
jgi:beta-glucosidase-like glycosyl hydrolase